MKAIILVGGFGTRLRPLTLTLPKPLVEFANKPMIQHQIEALAAAGVTDVVLAVNYRPEIMAEALKEYEKLYNVKVTFSVETEPLGTAGPLKLAEAILGKDDSPFFVLNADVTCEYPFAQLAQFHKQHGDEGTIVVTKVEEPSKYGVVVHKPSHPSRIDRFVEKPVEFVGNRINAGIYILNPSVLQRIELRPTSIEQETFPAICKDGGLHSFDLEGFWMDVGQPKDFLSGTCLYLSMLQRKNPKLLVSPNEPYVYGGNVMIDETAKIGKNCRIGPNVTIGPNVVIGDGVRLQRCVLLKNSRVKDHAWVKSTIVGWNSSVGKWARLENVTVLGDDVSIGDEVYVNGGSVLPHKSIKQNVDTPSIIIQSQSPTTSQLPTAVATAAASRKSSLPTAITLGPATDESKSALSSSSASAARTQQQDIKLYLRFFTFMMILMGIHSFLDMILWLPTLYLLAVTFIHLIFGGYNSSLKFCGFRTFALAATVYTLFHSVVDDSKSFYSAGILLYFIFGSRNDLLSPSSAYRSACSLDTVQEVKGHHEHKAPEARLSLSLVISQIDSAPGSLPPCHRSLLATEIIATHQTVASSDECNKDDVILKQEQEDVATFGTTSATTPADSPSDHRVSELATEQLAGADTCGDSFMHSLVLYGVDASVIVNGDSIAETIEHSQTDTASTSSSVASETSFSIPSETAGSDQSTKLATSKSAGSTHTVASSIGGGISIVDFLGSNRNDVVAVVPQLHIIARVQSPLPEPEHIEDVLNGFYALLSEVYDDERSDDTMRCLSRFFNGFDIFAEIRDAGVILARAMKEQKSTIGGKWTTIFCEAPLYYARVQKRNAGLLGVTYLPSESAPDPVDSNDSADVWSDDRSLAGDILDLDWLYFQLQIFISPATLKSFGGAARGQLIAARSERTGLNAMVQHFLELWYQVFSKHSSIQAVLNSHKRRARKQSGQQQYLTGPQTVAINERCSDYHFCNPEAEVCKLLLDLRSKPEHDQVIKTNTNSVISWMDKINEGDLFNSYDYWTCSCGYKAMDNLLDYRGDDGAYDSLFELNFLDSEALAADWDRKKRDDRQKAKSTPPRCREIH
ncbi:mannose-1-phosphate guanyltransferase [Didymella keratinophila]|nr:mannose-1-phosphate guanyltransferase [Didymella keratinophila]